MLKADFDTNVRYPNVLMPPPGGSWDLSEYGGVALDVTNLGSKQVRVFLRVDSQGHPKDKPWNTNSVKIPPGQTRTLQLVFGQDEGSPGYPLDTSHITLAQVFLVVPKQPTTLLLDKFHTIGAGQITNNREYTVENYTLPGDRDQDVTVPDWVGKRPPVEGQWTMTLDQTFTKMHELDKGIWGQRFSWNGILPSLSMYYTPTAVSLTPAGLKICIERRPGHAYDDPANPQKNYATGLVVTRNKWTQTYGYYEARIKMPTTRGIWPAFWLMPDRGAAYSDEPSPRETTFKGGMEMDIVEYNCADGPGRYSGGIHWDGYGERHQNAGSSYLFFGKTHDDWHTFGIL